MTFSCEGLDKGKTPNLLELVCGHVFHKRAGFERTWNARATARFRSRLARAWRRHGIQRG